MRDKFVSQIDGVEAHVETMADLARSMLLGGVAALKKLDREAANATISRGDELAQMDEDIEMEILKVLTLQQPMAKDLRKMGTAMKLITYVNRIGRYGYDIAKVTRDWPEGKDHVASIVGIEDMAKRVDQMLATAITAYRTDELPDMEAFMALENDVDQMRYSIFREALSYMSEDPHHIEPCAHYMMVARYLERCGDNIVKMVEKVHYSLTGQRLLLD